MRPVESLENVERTIALKMERERLRAALIANPETEEQDFFLFQARCIRKFGLAGGVLIRQLVFWADKGMDPEGWIYKTRTELEHELGLSERQQVKGRKTLRAAGVVEEELRTVAPYHYYRATHYRVNLQKLMELLETPHSTINQWKRGLRYERDPETGRFDRKNDPTPENGVPPAQEASDVPLAITDSDAPLTITDSDDPLDSTDSDDPLTITDSDTSLGTIDSGLSLDTSDSVTESTSRENVRENLKEYNRDIPHRELAGEADAINRATPPPKKYKSSKSNEGKGSTTSSPGQPDGEPKLVSEVRRLMESGRHTPVALKHFRTGKIKAEEVAAYVSQDATGSDDDADTFLPTVRLILEEVGVAS